MKYLDRYYLAYGSNLNIKEMSFRCPNSMIIDKGLLSGYKLCFKKYLTIEKDDLSCVPIAIYKVSNSDKIRLDKYESYPDFYHIKDINVVIDGKQYKCFTYIMNDGYKHMLPTFEYFKRCIVGYIEYGFNIRYLEKALEDCIKNIPKGSGIDE